MAMKPTTPRIAGVNAAHADNYTTESKQDTGSEILDAFEKVRAHRAWVYSFDALYESDPAAWEKGREATELADDELIALEKVVLDNWAETPTEVAAQLALALTEQCERWIDTALSERGILALYNERDGLDGQSTIIITAACELLHIEWGQALANYRRGKADEELFLSLKSAIDTEHFRTRGEKPVVSDGMSRVLELCDQAEERFSNTDAIERLIRTQSPHFDAYRLKAQIAIDEGYASDAAPWLLRDANLLMMEA